MEFLARGPDASPRAARTSAWMSASAVPALSKKAKPLPSMSAILPTATPMRRHPHPKSAIMVTICETVSPEGAGMGNVGSAMPPA